MKLCQIREQLGTEVLEEKMNPMAEISSIAYDSRKVAKDSLFIAIKGFQSDGHQYIPAAIQNGAIAVLAEEKEKVPAEAENYMIVKDTRLALSRISSVFYHNPTECVDVIGVTGTKGKTTVTHLVWSILKKQGKKPLLIGTNGMKFEKEVSPLNRTTPEALELMEAIDKRKKEGAEAVVMEVSSHSLDLFRVHDIHFKGIVFTNLTHEHLDYHKTMEQYFKAKEKLFQMAHSYAVINIDNDWGKTLYQRYPENAYSYGIDREEADIRAKDIQYLLDGSVFQCITPKGDFAVRINTPGKFSIYNALAAIGVALKEEVPTQVIQEALRELHAVDGRFEVVNPNGKFTVVVDYAHTPDSLENVLKTAVEMKQGKVITVFGCGGDRDRTKRPMMGEISVRYSDFTVITSDNPRTEDPFAIIDEIEAGAHGQNPYICIENREAAISHAIHMAKPGDLVIIAGKGHEDYQEIHGVKHHFDDREVARKILEECGE